MIHCTCLLSTQLYFDLNASNAELMRAYGPKQSGVLSQLLTFEYLPLYVAYVLAGGFVFPFP
eukprot:4924747-Amphidinium_carterae.1